MTSSLTRKATAVLLTLTLVIAATFAVPNAGDINCLYHYGTIVVQSHLGTFNDTTYVDGDIYVIQPSVRLTNLVVYGDIYITADRPGIPTSKPGYSRYHETDAVGVGSVYLTNVQVYGNIYVQGTAPVRLRGTAEAIEIDNMVRFTFIEGGADVLVITENGKDSVITLNKGVHIDRAYVETFTTIKGEGTIRKVMLPLHYYSIYIQPGMVPFVRSESYPYPQNNIDETNVRIR